MRGRLGLACLCVLGLAAALGAGEAAAAECPNEAIRIAQRSTALPECRAYEQVSPVDKNGANVFQEERFGGIPSTIGVSVSRDGDAATYRFTGPLADSGSAPLWNFANSTRGVNWSARGIASPQNPFPVIGGFLSTTLGVSEDQSHVVTYSEQVLAPGATEGDGNYYVFTPATGAYRWIGSFPNPSDTYKGGVVLGVSNSGDHVFFTETNVMVPGATPGEANVYEYNGGQLRLVTTPGWALSEIGTDTRLHPLSADGSRFFFEQEELVEFGQPVPMGLFMSENGGPAVPISVSHVPGDPAAPLPADFAGATPDGSVVYMISHGRLTPDVADDGSFRLYRYEVDTDTMTALTTTSLSAEGPRVSYLAGFPKAEEVSDDGSYVYFKASRLTPDAPEGLQNVFGWHDGELRYITTLPESPTNLDSVVSPDGTKLAIASNGQLTAFDNKGTEAACGNHNEMPRECLEVYLYDWDTDDLNCVSCPDRSGDPVGHGLMGQSLILVGSGGQMPTHNVVTDDGTVFFDTPEQLLPADTNGRRDVYSYKDGEVQLISTGTSPSDSFFHNITPSGSDVFFSTGQRLVGQDRDNQVDLYDARVAGGLASQQPPPQPEPCSGSACLGPAQPPPGAQTISSNRIEGAGNVRGRHHKAKKRCGPKKRAHGKKRAQAKSKQLRAKACKGGNR